MNLVLYFGIITYLYLTINVAAKIGIEQVGTASSLIIVLLSVYNIITFNKNKLISQFKEEFFIVLLTLHIIVIKFIINGFADIRGVVFFLVIPVLVSVLLDVQKGEVKKKISYIMLFFFITECLLALYERAFAVYVFPEIADLLESVAFETKEFRSTAFLGHPLQNALCVSTIMGFILVTPMKLIYKVLFFLMGYIALLCFNARGTILIWTVLISIYLVTIAFGKNNKSLTSFPMLILFTFAIYLLYEIIVNRGFGDRFFRGELIDGSAQTRLDIFDAFSDVNGADFWLGNSLNVDKLLSTSGSGGYENSYILIITNYGLIMSLMLFVLFFFWIKRLLRHYTSFNKSIIISSFIVVGSMNNSLATSTPWMFFILCANSFLFFNQSHIGPNKEALLQLKESYFQRSKYHNRSRD